MGCDNKGCDCATCPKKAPSPTWVQELPTVCPHCRRGVPPERGSLWDRVGFLLGDGGREGHVYECSVCGGVVVRLSTRADPATIAFAAKFDVVAARAHVRLHRATPSGDFGVFLGANVMEKHEAEAFVRMVKADYDKKDTAVRACSGCGGNICSAEGVTGDKCPPCEEDFKAGKAKPSEQAEAFARIDESAQCVPPPKYGYRRAWWPDCPSSTDPPVKGKTPHLVSRPAQSARLDEYDPLSRTRMEHLAMTPTSDMDLYQATAIVQVFGSGWRMTPRPKNEYGEGYDTIDGPSGVTYRIPIVITRSEAEAESGHAESRRQLAKALRDAADLIEAGLPDPEPKGVGE